MAREKRKKNDCYCCKEKKEPSFLEFEVLSRFISERGKIMARTRTFLCAKHQRRIKREIKRARYLALFPYMVRPE